MVAPHKATRDLSLGLQRLARWLGTDQRADAPAATS
jgi:hypothetical protein